MAAWMFQPHIGIVNSVLKSLGFQGRPLWLNSTELVMPTIIGTAVWRSVGYSMVIFTAGLMNIPPDLYEAAQVDGANKWTSFWRITLPLLKPTTLFVFCDHNHLRLPGFHRTLADVRRVGRARRAE